MNKRILIFTFIILLFSTNISFAENDIPFDNTFKDIKTTDWFMPTVSKLVGLGGISGYPDNTFRPNKEITKGEFTKILISTLEHNVEDSKTYHWAMSHIKKAEELNILDKDEFIEKEFNDPIKRYETARMLARVLELINEEKTKNVKDYVTSIKDFYNVPRNRPRLINGVRRLDLGEPTTYREDVLEVYSKGIITGYPDGMFNPTKNLTRAEASAMIIRIIDETERKVPQRPKTDPNWIEPEFEVYYTTYQKDFYDYFQIYISNIDDYTINIQKGIYDTSYTFTTELISPKNLKVLEFYDIIDKKYYKYDTMARYENVKINTFPSGQIFALESLRRTRYVDTKKDVKLKEGQELIYKIKVSNGKKTKEYIIKAEFRDKKFRY